MRNENAAVYRGGYALKYFLKGHENSHWYFQSFIKQGMPIYQVSKLLGHASVTTTEKHYAPLLATDVEEFVL